MSEHIVEGKFEKRFREVAEVILESNEQENSKDWQGNPLYILEELGMDWEKFKSLVDEAKEEIFKLATEAFVDKCHPELWKKLLEWFGNP